MTTSLVGNNSFQIKAHANELINKFIEQHGDLALEKLDGGETSIEQILGAVESLPFLAAKKMVVVNDLSTNSAASDFLEQLVERAGDTTDLVIVEAKLDKRSVYYKQLKKVTEFHEYDEMDEHQLAEWLVGESKARGGKLSAADARYLVQRSGTGQMKASREIEKLLQYNQEITRQTIDLLVEESPSSTIFNLIDQIFSGNLKEALRLYDDQRQQRVEPQAIHAMLVWQMHAVAIVSAAPTGTSPAQIAKDSGLSPFVVQKSQRIARQMGRAKIIEFMKLLRDIDYRGKHEALDYDEALRYAFGTLSSEETKRPLEKGPDF